MEAFFLNAKGKQRFCLFHSPLQGQAVHGGLLYIHPFAEEMNRARRMVSLQAKAFAKAGYAVLQMDLDGCGDSAGDFSGASWESWLADLAVAWDWLATRVDAPLWLWGLRSGCFLASQFADQSLNHRANLLFWQPVLSGRQHLTQFLRLKFASDLVRGSPHGFQGSEQLMTHIAAGHTVEVAGYGLSPALALGLDRATLTALRAPAKVICFELSGSQDEPYSPALQKQILHWKASGCEVAGSALEGPTFWQTVETTTCPALMVASVAAITAMTAITNKGPH